MKHYPVYLNLKGREVLLIGGGTIALQKLPALLEGEATLTVVAPEALPEIEQFAKEGKIRWHRRSYETSDLESVSLVIAATDDPELQKRVAAESRERKIWVNVVDVPPLCDFIAPAIVRRGEIQIAISTGGAAPALAKFLRKRMEEWVGPPYEALVSLVQRWRPDILKLPKEKRNRLWEALINDAVLDELRHKGPEAIELRLKEWIDGKPTL